MKKFRFIGGNAYVYDLECNAFLFCGKLNGRSKKQFIAEYAE
jgi:hypothetical protein